jgi:hypothetical protein
VISDKAGKEPRQAAPENRPPPDHGKHLLIRNLSKSGLFAERDYLKIQGLAAGCLFR